MEQFQVLGHQPGSSSVPSGVVLLMEPSFQAVLTDALEASALTLARDGMSCVNWDCSDTEFEFVFGKDKICRVHSFMAEFLSPKVAHLRRCDITFNVYTFQDSEVFNVFECLLSSLSSGEAFRVEKSNFAALLRLSQELENAELLSSLFAMINPESLSLAEAIRLLRVETDLGSAFSDRFGKVRNFIASHFYEIDKEILDFETLQLLLSSPALQIEDEDSLYDFVRSRSEDDLRFRSLFEFVYFDYLSVDRIENFASSLNEKSLNDTNYGVWGQICRRLMLEPKLTENPRQVRSNFKFDASKPLQGIIAFLTRQYDGTLRNVHDQGIVNITASSVLNNKPCFHPKNAADFETEWQFYSENQANSWICYDFKERRVSPTSYSVRSNTQSRAGDHLRSWVVEVSNDAESWIEIDRQEDNPTLQASLALKNFKISTVPNGAFRFFRLRNIGTTNSGGYRYLIITGLEIFGTFYWK